MYDSLQFPVEINTRGSKTLTTFIPFHTKYDLQEQFGLFSHSYLQNGMLWLQNNFSILHDLKTDTFERYWHIYSFICMSHFGDEELRYESRQTTVQQNSSNLHKEVKIAWLHQRIRFYITFAFVNTIG